MKELVFIIHSMIEKGGYVYILGNKKPTLYIGVTSDLIGRIWEHKNKFYKGFSSKYVVSKLLYYEFFESIEFAIEREKQLKHWKRSWKLDLIRKSNPTFKDISYQISE